MPRAYWAAYKVLNLADTETTAVEATIVAALIVFTLDFI
jgi:hypothetical protein